MTTCLRRGAPLVALVLAAVAGCEGAPTAPSRSEVSHQRDLWLAQGIANYRYVFRTEGFFNARDGRAFEITVREGSVTAAVEVATGDSMPPDAFGPVIGLFDEAQSAIADGRLASITFDPTYHYPTVLNLSGPPDASGQVTASALHPVP
jgi:Family of unknown function (DUF6174)